MGSNASHVESEVDAQSASEIVLARRGSLPQARTPPPPLEPGGTPDYGSEMGAANFVHLMYGDLCHGAQCVNLVTVFSPTADRPSIYTDPDSEIPVDLTNYRWLIRQGIPVTQQEELVSKVQTRFEAKGLRWTEGLVLNRYIVGLKTWPLIDNDVVESRLLDDVHLPFTGQAIAATVCPSDYTKVLSGSSYEYSMGFALSGNAEFRELTGKISFP